MERFPYIPARDLVYVPSQLIVDRAESFHRDAAHLLDYLCLPEFDEPAMADTYDALGAWRDMEEHAFEIHDTTQLASPAPELAVQMTIFHTALPFGESERRCLSDIPFEGPLDNTEESLAYEHQIVSQGIHKIIAGHELIDRWVEWRRQTGRYSGQGTLDLARTMLARIAKNARCDIPLPESYLKLHLWPKHEPLPPVSRWRLGQNVSS